MGQLFTKLWARMVSGCKPARLLIIGLDAAGKTTVLYRLKLGEIVATTPTIGFNVETVEYKNVSFTVWDVGGQEKTRELCRRHYYNGVNGLIFVVDSNDPSRLEEAKAELGKVLAEDELLGVPLIVFANKQDLPNALKVTDVGDRLGLKQVRNRQWHIQGTYALLGDGLYEGLDWVTSTLKNKNK